MRYHFVREFVVDKLIKIIFIKSADNLADSFTKNVTIPIYENHSKEIIVPEPKWSFVILSILRFYISTLLDCITTYIWTREADKCAHTTNICVQSMCDRWQLSRICNSQHCQAIAKSGLQLSGF